MLHVFCLTFSCEIFSEFSRLHVFCSEKLILHVEFVVNRCEFNDELNLGKFNYEM